MLKQSITYTDYNGVERTENFYFNLTKAEAIELEASVPGGFQKYLTDISNAGNFTEIVAAIKKLILISYGEKSPDGKRFIKSEVLKNEFAQTAAYSELYIKLATDENAAIAFVQSVLSEKPDPAAVAKARAEYKKQVEQLTTPSDPLGLAKSPADSEASEGPGTASEDSVSPEPITTN